ncbi:MAG: GAF domain-containing protein [Gammaproteobacteria bacterium]|nr:GAF domain-containing protein [Gammaproteobacteria bacterium]
MFELKESNTADKPAFYQELCSQARGLLSGEKDLIANAANISSLLFHSLPDVNWVGFYFLKNGELVVGPFQGKPACVRIALGAGVCGKAAQDRETVRVANVHEFAEHIPCDADSNSEIVIPLINRGEVIGVLDVDSPVFDRFDQDDQQGLESLVEVFVNNVAD